MRYNKTITLSNGMECCLRNGTESDGQLVLDNFNLTHSETDYLLTYPDENSFDAARESQYLKEKAESEREIELLAIVDGTIVGTAGIDAIGTKYKVRHRAEFGISVVRKYWGLGIGKALLTSCIECAKRAGYSQLELKVVAENERAVSMYDRAGFVECGRNPKGFCSRIAGFQEVITMRLELC
ncbi:MAG: GNAT family N-acetyltransferase [Lachnospiraceae bacterium]|nr:GNAT family N-acetyltransferase [Lachnospiraceae bacterium]